MRGAMSVLTTLSFILLCQMATCFRLQLTWPKRDLFVFGDSLSDNGNLLALTKGQRPNTSLYFQGRFSNGYVWNEFLAKAAKLKLTNKAIGGAQACTRAFDIPTLKEQITAVGTPKINKNSIAAFTIGGNDYLTPVRFFNTTAPPPEKVVKCITDAVEQLLNLGFNNILVWNLAVGPAPTEGGAVVSGPLAQAADLFVLHNQVLADELTHVQYRNPYAKIRIFDLFEAARELFSGGAGAFKFPNEPCLKFDNADKLLSKCETPNEHVLYDQLHPTARVHEFFADQIQEQLDAHYWL